MKRREKVAHKQFKKVVKKEKKKEAERKEDFRNCPAIRRDKWRTLTFTTQKN